MIRGEKDELEKDQKKQEFHSRKYPDRDHAVYDPDGMLLYSL